MQNEYKKDRNNFFDEPSTRQRNDSNRVRPSAGKKRKKGGIPLALIFVIDVAIAAVALLAFSLYYFILPRELGQEAVVLPGAKPSDAAVASASEPPDNLETEQPGVQTTDNSGEQAVQADPNSWRAKFADKFTSGDVEKTDSSYKNANVSVTVDTVAKDGVTYFVADIYLADIKYFKSAFANDKFVSGNAESTVAIANENNAVIAINGDYCTLNEGVVVRNGVQYRGDKFTLDQLVLFNDGTMKTYAPEEFNYDELINQGVYQVWTFGPMLLKDGQPMEEFNCSVNPRNPRTAVGYFEPGHYCFVVVDGRQDNYSVGYSTKELSSLMFSLGCTVAFNLDGGQSSEMAFGGSLVNMPFDGGRGTSDILYIAGE